MGLPLAPVGHCQHCDPPRVVSQVVPLGPHQEVTLSITRHNHLPKGAGKELLLPLWVQSETEGGMDEGVTYADLRLPPTPGNGELLSAPGTMEGPLLFCSPLPSVGPFP